jgi:hypothetical protein
MNRCRAFTHAAPTRETDLPIKFHDQNAPTLPVARKGQSGKVLLCPQQDYLATSVANFCIAVLKVDDDDFMLPMNEELLFRVCSLADALD